MKKVIRIFFSFFIFLFAFWLLYLNCKLFHQPDFSTDVKFEINSDLLHQLRFLKTEIHNGAADEMQNDYPEGFLFMNELYGLSWCEVAKEIDPSMDLYKEAHTEIQFAFSEVNSEKGKKVFSKYLPVPYGIFYAGWNNYLLGKKLSIEKSTERDTAELSQFNRQCNEIATVLNNPNTPYPESYEYAAWPSDAMVAVASLALERKIEKPKHADDIAHWINRIKTKLDTNGLIPHSVAYWDGKPEKFAEGNSQCLMLNFLHEIDSVFARQQFQIFKSKFLTTRLGLPAIRQDPEGAEGSGDVDSGPVIFGIGGAASIIGMRTMAIYGDQKTAIGLRNSVDAFGFASTSDGKKKYLFGKFPIADAFIAWSNSAEISKNKSLFTNENWRWKFQLYSFLILLGLVFIFMKTWRINFRRKQKLQQ
jgi:hypothetical protein